MKKTVIDTEWFLKQLEARELSVRELASKMTNRQGNVMDRGDLWRLLHGERAREMTVAEASRLSELLEQPVEEIVRRALGKRR